MWRSFGCDSKKLSRAVLLCLKLRLTFRYHFCEKALCIRCVLRVYMLECGRVVTSNRELCADSSDSGYDLPSHVGLKLK